MIDQCHGFIYHLTGFENSAVDGKAAYFNFVFSNGSRSTQKGTFHTHMIPANALKKIRKVKIHYTPSERIAGFSFFYNNNRIIITSKVGTNIRQFDKEKKLMFKLGGTNTYYEKEKVELAENEVIVGVVAKLFPGLQSIYTDF